MAPTEKDSYDLARNYGLDISMPDVNLAVSTAAQKIYAKKCNNLYKEFQKKLSFLIKEEQVVRRDLMKLKKEKAVNSRYSLYRTEGADLFSKACQKRKTYRENNLATISPLLEDCFDFTPCGIDSVIAEEDETEERPKTAPGDNSQLPVDKIVGADVDSVFEDNRPKTAGISLKEGKKTSKADVKSNIIKPRERKNSEPDHKDSKGNERKSLEEIKLPEQKIAQIDRLLKSASQVRSNPIDNEMTSLPELKSEEESDKEDGEVDVQTERTRARKITIKAEKFLELERGKTTVTLKDKEGEFILKPLNINYEPDEVEAVFFAKDPTREKMALVRQKTSWNSQTVASDLKVNNRMAIQKSLMGLSSKKTTVAEIFNNARDRRTRHFRIMLKNPLLNAENEEAEKDRKKSIIVVPPGMTRWKSLAVATKVASSFKPKEEKRPATTAVHLYKHQKKMVSKQDAKPSTKATRTTMTRPHVKSESESLSKPESAPIKQHLRVTITSPSGADKNVPLQTKINKKGSDDHSELFHRVKHFPKGQDSKPLNRSSTSMSNREDIPLHLSDRDMTDMIRKMVEADNDSRSEAPDVKKRKGGNRLQKTPTADNLSETDSIYFGNVRRLLSSNQARQIIKDLKRRDQEYDDAMLNMRRRVAIGAQGHNFMRRPNSVAGFR
ncbi:uncharacterized protein LOC133178230 [Saccostrea echinata]|uniref:uncharacterized protein LOC133178230 n=1 Tax=Saccostrea echinata TaxID=191078 RepID=UPI002A828C45|nr:uncharacterized protein LOC133178230 [Saccostrea echinata]